MMDAVAVRFMQCILLFDHHDHHPRLAVMCWRGDQVQAPGGIASQPGRVVWSRRPASQWGTGQDSPAFACGGRPVCPTPAMVIGPRFLVQPSDWLPQPHADAT